MNRLARQLGALWDELPVPDSPVGTNVFSAARMPSCEHHRVGKDSDSNTAILIAIDSRHEYRPVAPLILENLSVLHGVVCNVTEADGSVHSGTFTVLRCTSRDQSLRDYFLTLVSTVVRDLPAQVPFDIAAAAIDQMVELFRALSKPSGRSIQGLWAELFVISVASDPATLVRAWRTDPGECSDFSADRMRIEVKSTRFRVRNHVFSLAQLTPPSGTRLIIASVYVERSAAGVSVRDLWTDARGTVENESGLLFHLDRVVSTSLGLAWRRSLDRRFDWQLARDSLAFYHARAVPSIAQDAPTEVTEIRFRSNLSGVAAIHEDELRRSIGLFSAVAPRAPAARSPPSASSSPQ